VGRQLAALPLRLRRRIIGRIEALGEQPHPPGAEALAGGLRGRFRLRVGDYRVLYGVRDEESTIVVFSVGHRSRIYRDAERQD
jgi:mRNA interferase RelE/StbE